MTRGYFTGKTLRTLALDTPLRTVARKFSIVGICVSVGLWVCAGGLDTLKIDKMSTRFVTRRAQGERIPQEKSPP